MLFSNAGVPNQGSEAACWGVRDGHSDFCTVMLSLSCANCSAQSVSNYSMPCARSSIQPETMLISKKKGQHMQFQLILQNWPTSWPGTCLNVLGLRAITKIENHCSNATLSELFVKYNTAIPLSATVNACFYHGKMSCSKSDLDSAVNGEYLG